MSTERDTTRIVRSWLQADEHESADRVLQIVLAGLDTTPQRRSWWPARRFAQMNRLVLTAGAAAAVLLVAILGYNLLPRGGVGTQPTVAPSPTTRPSPAPSPTAAPTTGPIVGTWATGATTCAQQLAAIEAAGYTAEQMTSVGVDLTCKNGITAEGAGWAGGSQFTMQFFPDGTLRRSDNVYGDSTFTYRLIGDATFEAADDHPGDICITYGYAIEGDQLTVEIIDKGCPATHAGLAEAPLLDQIGLTVFFDTSPFTRQP
jgi:hypothetical protein